MSVEIVELEDSGQFSSQRGQKKYSVFGTNDAAAARTAVLALAPATYQSLVRQDADANPITHVVAGNDVVDVVVNYARSVPSQYQTGKTTEAWSTTGGTQHVTQSISSVGYGPGANATANKGAILVDPETKEVRGVDIVIPQRSLTLRVELSPAEVTEAWQEQLTALTGRVNQATFRGHAAGEVLFLGAESPGFTTGDPFYPITYSFAVSPNLSNVTIGDITSIVKFGWEFLDVRYKQIESGSELFLQPQAVYRHALYYNGDFTILKFPV